MDLKGIMLRWKKISDHILYDSIFMAFSNAVIRETENKLVIAGG